MKKHLLYLSLLAAFFFCNKSDLQAQENFSFSITPHYSNFGTGFEKGICLQFDIPIEEKLTLNYSLGFGQHEKGGTYFHYTLGSLISLKVPGFFVNNSGMSGDDVKAMIGVMVVLALIPEGITYYSINKEHFKLGPYLNLTGIDTYYDYEGFNYKQLVPEAGMKSRIVFGERSFINLSAGLKFQTRFERPGLHMGLGLGFYFE